MYIPGNELIRIMKQLRRDSEELPHCTLEEAVPRGSLRYGLDVFLLEEDLNARPSNKTPSFRPVR